MTADATGVRLTWLGQSGFLMESERLRVGCDLYLSDHLEAKYRGTDKPHVRLHDAPVRPEQLTGLDYVFASHRHSDHLDPGSIADVLAASPDAVLVLPEAIRDYARDQLGVPEARMCGARPGDRVGPFELVQAAHPEPEPQFLSALVRIDGLTIFHSGDTLVFEAQRDALRHARPDVVLLPVNGRVAEHLGTPPNMSLGEAIHLARECGAGLLVPHHYDLFAFNSVDPATVRSTLGRCGLPHLVMHVGQRVELRQIEARVQVAAL